MNKLLGMQRCFAAALAEPLDGQARGLAGLPPARAGLPATTSFPAAGLLRGTQALGAEERLGLYRRQYWFRLLDSLAEDFTGLEALLGRPRLLSLLEAYILAHPPSSWDLRAFGEHLPAFAARHAGIPAEFRLLAAALARRDYAFMEVVVAGRAPEPGDSVLMSSALGLQPCVRVLCLRAPVQDWLESPERQPPPRVSRHHRELHVVWRARDNGLRARREALGLLPLLRELGRGGPLPELIDRSRRLPSPGLLRDAFARWRAEGLLALVSPQPSNA